jgi:hypothetical protein
VTIDGTRGPIEDHPHLAGTASPLLAAWPNDPPPSTEPGTDIARPPVTADEIIDPGRSFDQASPPRAAPPCPPRKQPAS